MTWRAYKADTLPFHCPCCRAITDRQVWQPIMLLISFISSAWMHWAHESESKGWMWENYLAATWRNGGDISPLSRTIQSMLVLALQTTAASLAGKMKEQNKFSTARTRSYPLDRGKESQSRIIKQKAQCCKLTKQAAFSLGCPKGQVVLSPLLP